MQRSRRRGTSLCFCARFTVLRDGVLGDQCILAVGYAFALVREFGHA
jgi:hypothetical protein